MKQYINVTLALCAALFMSACAGTKEMAHKAPSRASKTAVRTTLTKTEPVRTKAAKIPKSLAIVEYSEDLSSAPQEPVMTDTPDLAPVDALPQPEPLPEAATEPQLEPETAPAKAVVSSENDESELQKQVKLEQLRKEAEEIKANIEENNQVLTELQQQTEEATKNLVNFKEKHLEDHIDIKVGTVSTIDAPVAEPIKESEIVIHYENGALPEHISSLMVVDGESNHLSEPVDPDGSAAPILKLTNPISFPVEKDIELRVVGWIKKTAPEGATFIFGEPEAMKVTVKEGALVQEKIIEERLVGQSDNMLLEEEKEIIKAAAEKLPPEEKKELREYLNTEGINDVTRALAETRNSANNLNQTPGPVPVTVNAADGFPTDMDVDNALVHVHTQDGIKNRLGDPQDTKKDKPRDSVPAD